MFRVARTVEISAAHRLPGHPKCGKVHGHNYRITVWAEAQNVDHRGMVVDFGEISEIVKRFDHTTIKIGGMPPTAEIIARHICEEIENATKVRVEETTGSWAEFEAYP